jgi:hypothetical protein
MVAPIGPFVAADAPSSGRDVRGRERGQNGVSGEVVAVEHFLCSKEPPPQLPRTAPYGLMSCTDPRKDTNARIA